MEERGWSLPRRVAFRAGFVYLVLFNLPFPLNVLPGSEGVEAAWARAWLSPFQWVCDHVLHWQRVLRASGSNGDSAFYVVQLLCFGVLALVVAAAWTALARRAREHRALLELLRSYLRYSAGFAIIGYGLAKVFDVQFPFPAAHRLVQTFGESSPAGLLWTFMGYSRPYAFFAGACEVLGGLLLLWRRTYALGALLLLPVLVQVALVNLCYGVQVKIFSLHLLATDLFLAAPALWRIFQLLALERPAQPHCPAPWQPPRPWMRLPLVVGQLAFVGYVLFDQTRGARVLEQQRKQAPALAGVYQVEAQAAGRRWRRLVVESFGGAASIVFADGTDRRFGFQDLPAAKKLELVGKGGQPRFGFDYQRSGDDGLALSGVLDGEPVQVELRKLRVEALPLLTYRFRWIAD